VKNEGNIRGARRKDATPCEYAGRNGGRLGGAG